MEHEQEQLVGDRTEQVPTFCALCVSKCGAVATVTDGVLTALRPDPSHPTGAGLCIKGRAAPELVAHPDRLTHPLRRTTARGAPDPGWERIGWDEALDLVAERLRSLADDHGPEAVAFASASPSTTAMSDSVDWLMRLRRAFGSPNFITSMELCGWGRYLAPLYTFGAPVPGVYMPDLEQAGCILFWGYNPSVSRLDHAITTTRAVARGARLVVVDPRRAGLATKADQWLRVRPGTDGALALAIAHVMLEHGWYDDAFVRDWTTAPLLVRDDTDRLLRSGDVDGDDGTRYVAWDGVDHAPVALDPVTGTYEVAAGRLALGDQHVVETADGPVTCRPVFARLVEQCAAMPPRRAEEVTGVPADQVEATARLLWEARPVAYYGWSGLEQHSSTTQSVRSILQLWALTGSLDVPGGNVRFPTVPTNPVDGADLLADDQRRRAVGVERRPLGPAAFEFITGEDAYRAMLDHEPYRIRGLVDFGSNLTMAHGDTGRGREALATLDLYVHADLFMSPTAEFADVVLPVASAFEAEALRVGFEVSTDAQSLVQLRRPVAPRLGESRSDLEIMFDLAVRLGLGEHFFGGDLDAAWRHQLAPSGLSLEELRARPEGIRVPLEVRYRKHEAAAGNGAAGFRTPTGKVELWSEVMLDHGYPATGTFEEPATSPRSRPDLARRFPLVLTSAKSLHYCETQHRGLASLRSRVPDPEVQLHPDTAAARGIGKDDWVTITTPLGQVRARAALDANLDPQVVVGQHGWWQPCDELDLAGYPPVGQGSANLNAVLAQTPSDPISGSSPLRASVCEVAPLLVDLAAEEQARRPSVDAG